MPRSSALDIDRWETNTYEAFQSVMLGKSWKHSANGNKTAVHIYFNVCILTILGLYVKDEFLVWTAVGRRIGVIV